MAGYLKKYVGTYRVIAEYDKASNDYPRDNLGNIDSSFDDYYIKCKSGIKIMHYRGSTLICYIPSRLKGLNILRKIYKQYFGSEAKNNEQLLKKLVEEKILIKILDLDFEVEFLFKATLIEDIAKIVKPSTNGAKISPLSPKNLPKVKYIIPESDLALYKNAIGEVKQDKLIKLNKINRDFESIIIKKKGKDFKSDQKKLMLDRKSYIHKIGLWGNYIKFLIEQFQFLNLS